MGAREVRRPPVARHIMLIVSRGLADALRRLEMWFHQIILLRHVVVIARTVVLVMLKIYLKHWLRKWNVDVFTRWTFALTSTASAQHVVVLSSRNQLFQHWSVHVGRRFIAHWVGARTVACNRLWQKQMLTNHLRRYMRRCVMAANWCDHVTKATRNRERRGDSR